MCDEWGRLAWGRLCGCMMLHDGVRQRGKSYVEECVGGIARVVLVGGDAMPMLAWPSCHGAGDSKGATPLTVGVSSLHSPLYLTMYLPFLYCHRVPNPWRSPPSQSPSYLSPFL